MIKKIIITGGGGYIGTNLVKHLLKKKYHVKVIDTFWFGNYLKKSKNLNIIKKDIRNITKNGDGDYTLKFIDPMKNSYYAVNVSTSSADQTITQKKTTNSVNIINKSGGNSHDSSIIDVIIY